MTSQPAKDTIYIDPEDEITGIIEKVRSSQAKIVALVLPKRATSLQSIVNLKLLKRTSSEAKKSLVLITSDPGLLPIAGAVGLHVAKTLQSKPAIPKAPKLNEGPVTVDDDTPGPDGDVDLDPRAPIGQLAGQVATEDTIDLDNDDKDAIAATQGAKAVAAKKSLSKKLKIPDFDRFRLLILAGAGLLTLLTIGSIFAFMILPKAHISIKTDTASVQTDLSPVAKTDAEELDIEKQIIPATKKELKKTENEKVPTSGQRDEGTKAKGTATLTLTDCSQDQVTIPAGTGIKSADLIFVTQAEVVLKSVKIGSQCHNSDFKDFSTAKVNVLAQAAGDKYNLGERAYTVIGFGNVTAYGSNMTGGTSKIVKVVAQADVDNAKQKVLERLNAAATAELKAQFESEDNVVLTDTYAATEPITTNTPNLNDEANEVTVNVTITYSQLGIKKDHLKELIEADVKKHIDTSKQTIQDNGADKAVIRLADKISTDEVKLTIQAIATAGPQLDADGIKKQVAGKKKGETVKLIQERPGINDVEVDYSPFWVFSTPKSAKKITITFDQNNATQ